MLLATVEGEGRSGTHLNGNVVAVSELANEEAGHGRCCIALISVRLDDWTCGKEGVSSGQPSAARAKNLDASSERAATRASHCKRNQVKQCE